VNGPSSSIQIETLEWTGKSPTRPCHYGSARSEVEVCRCETFRIPGYRQSLAHQERNEDSIVEENRSRRQDQGRRWRQDHPRRPHLPRAVESRPWPFPRHPAGSVRHPLGQRTPRHRPRQCPSGAGVQREGSSVHAQKPLLSRPWSPLHCIPPRFTRKPHGCSSNQQSPEVLFSRLTKLLGSSTGVEVVRSDSVRSFSHDRQRPTSRHVHRRVRG
jgi:hypothetical protein